MLYCVDCGEPIELEDLSQESIRNVFNPLDRPTCKTCALEDLGVWDEEPAPRTVWGRMLTTQETWEFSGTNLEPAKLQAHFLNY